MAIVDHEWSTANATQLFGDASIVVHDDAAWNAERPGRELSATGHTDTATGSDPFAAVCYAACRRDFLRSLGVASS